VSPNANHSSKKALKELLRISRPPETLLRDQTGLANQMQMTRRDRKRKMRKRSKSYTRKKRRNMKIERDKILSDATKRRRGGENTDDRHPLRKKERII